ncbi:MAG: DUF5071 domain-containing protein [Lachnospiraceae bacterium]|nr:DUF5071 domain-containing protein [Lachnospiraceae bacterium]
MNKLLDIYANLRWDAPTEMQKKARQMALLTGLKEPFYQPCIAVFSKNIWDNCALVIANRDDEAFNENDFRKMLEWLMDYNWPGAYVIMKRLINFNDKNGLLNSQIRQALTMAELEKEGQWKYNLNLLLDKRNQRNHESNRNAVEVDFELRNLYSNEEYFLPLEGTVKQLWQNEYGVFFSLDHMSRPLPDNRFWIVNENSSESGIKELTTEQYIKIRTPYYLYPEEGYYYPVAEVITDKTLLIFQIGFQNFQNYVGSIHGSMTRGLPKFPTGLTRGSLPII